jgi:acetyl esterase
MLHPFVVAMLAKQRETGAPALSAGSPDDARALVTAGRPALGTGPDMARVEDVTVPTRAGSIGARLLVPRGDPVSLIVYVHGGGWVLGSPDDFETLGRELAFRSSSAVLLLDYRLAPEHPFPAGLEDVEDALGWLSATPEDLALPRVPLVVVGDSAGANLATVALRRSNGRIPAVLQVLAYPVADCDFDTGSYRHESDGMPLTRADMQWFFGHYAPSERHADPDISPSRADDLSRLPRTVILTAQHDVLRDDGEGYGRLLQQAGVAVAVRQYDGMAHGFLRLHNHIDVAHQAVLDLAADVERAVAAPVWAPGSASTRDDVGRGRGDEQ